MNLIVFKDLESINNYYAEMNEGGLVQYDHNENTLVFDFISPAGGEREDEVLRIYFKEVAIFHLPSYFSFADKCIDEIRVIPNNELKGLFPSHTPFNKEDICNKHYQYYRFFAEGVETDFYIYCATIEGALILYEMSCTLYYTNDSGALIYPPNGELFDYKKNKINAICYETYKDLHAAKRAGKAFVKEHPLSICHIRCGSKYKFVLNAEQEDFELTLRKNKRKEETTSSHFLWDIPSIIFFIIISIITYILFPFSILLSILEDKLSSWGVSDLFINIIFLAMISSLAYFIFW